MIFGYHDNRLCVGEKAKFLQWISLFRGGGVIDLLQADLSTLMYVYF